MEGPAGDGEADGAEPCGQGVRHPLSRRSGHQGPQGARSRPEEGGFGVNGGHCTGVVSFAAHASAASLQAAGRQKVYGRLPSAAVGCAGQRTLLGRCRKPGRASGPAALQAASCMCCTQCHGTLPPTSPYLCSLDQHRRLPALQEKNIQHNGNLALDDVVEIARIMRDRSCARELSGTVKEILGTCVSVGDDPSLHFFEDTVNRACSIFIRHMRLSRHADAPSPSTHSALRILNACMFSVFQRLHHI